MHMLNMSTSMRISKSLLRKDSYWLCWSSSRKDVVCCCRCVQQVDGSEGGQSYYINCYNCHVGRIVCFVRSSGDYRVRQLLRKNSRLSWRINGFQAQLLLVIYYEVDYQGKRYKSHIDQLRESHRRKLRAHYYPTSPALVTEACHQLRQHETLVINNVHLKLRWEH